MAPLVVYVEGLIGAGKSTLLKRIAELSPEHYRVILEPVGEWQSSGLLELFYSDVPRWAYTFQTYVCISRINNILNYVRKLTPDEYESTKIFFVERSIFSDRYFFMENLKDSITRVEYDVYGKWWETWRNILPIEFTKRYEFLYIKPSMDVVMNRVKIRNRHGEEGVSKEYQKTLQQKHDDFFQQPYLEFSDVAVGRTTEGSRFVMLTTDGEMNGDIAKRVVNRFE
jgi:deoxyadenosine/deoxycytidine kinase